MISDPVEAEDILQESFLVAFEQIGTYSGNVNFRVWLTSMVQNRATDRWRKNSNVIFEDINKILSGYFLRT
jgi:DNA-directed RNA polymerase specialized sigma24 family protein